MTSLSAGGPTISQVTTNGFIADPGYLNPNEVPPIYPFETVLITDGNDPVSATLTINGNATVTDSGQMTQVTDGPQLTQTKALYQSAVVSPTQLSSILEPIQVTPLPLHGGTDEKFGYGGGINMSLQVTDQLTGKQTGLGIFYQEIVPQSGLSISGATPSSVNYGGTVHPFAGIIIADADSLPGGAPINIGATILSSPFINNNELGSISGAGWVEVDEGDYDWTGNGGPSALTSALDNLTYKAPAQLGSSPAGPVTLTLMVGDNAFASTSASVNVALTVAPTPPAPPPVVHPNPPPTAGTHWADPLTPTSRIQFLGYPGAGGPQDALVDPAYYLASNPDVAAAGLNATQHYETYGWHEGRNPDALFSTAYYLTANPDVAAAGIDPMLHYEEFGWKEGRNPSASFSTNKYLSANPDVAAAGIDPLVHFEQFGSHEGRLIWHV